MIPHYIIDAYYWLGFSREKQKNSGKQAFFFMLSTINFRGIRLQKAWGFKPTLISSKIILKFCIAFSPILFFLSPVGTLYMFLHSLLFSFWVPVWTWDVSHSLNNFNNYLLTKFPSLIISIFVICFLNLCFLQEKYQEASNYWIQLYDMENCRQIQHRLSSKMKVCCLWRFTKRIYIYICTSSWRKENVKGNTK